ncbi:cytochrome b5-related protein-like [Bacillus rossius redtenbacheri]|uniref:cytochrome b5-related protein-like n=1 Tax=Bacillus rossius redtenbacheri TaxID=93214 RepID=UPI002FDEC2B4
MGLLDVSFDAEWLMQWLRAPARQKPPSSLPGLRYPSRRDEPVKSSALWLQGKREDDGAEGLWRVHDDLYDLSGWLDQHPGGADWLQLTKGTDITEAFEAYHISQLPEQILGSYRVRDAVTKRNSPYTFKEDGFYRTLKRRVRRELGDQRSGPTAESKLCADALLAATLASASFAAAAPSLAAGAASGLLLALTVIAAHNFFHQRDNFRMHYFNLSFMSARDWRVSHGLSHHIYTNTVLDLEMSITEPFLQWLPEPSKGWIARYLSWLYSPFVYSAIFHSQLLVRVYLFLRGEKKMFGAQDLFSVLVPGAMLLAGSSLAGALWMWLWILLVGSFFFGLIGLNAGHHHPDMFHDGDAPREDTDWGLCQLDAVGERREVNTCTLFALVSFGHHSLHHLFPSLDHGRLQRLYPALEATCREFGAACQVSSLWGMLRGQFLQLARNKPNRRPRWRRAGLAE